MYIKQLLIPVLLLATGSLVVTANWINFENVYYRILFPSLPASDTTKAASPAGNLMVYSHIYQSPENAADSNLAYSLTEIGYPPEMAKASTGAGFEKGFFRGAIDAAVKTINGKLLTEKEIVFKGYPGRDVLIDYGQGLAMVKMKIVFAKNRSYAIQTISLTGKENNQSSDRFFGSFELK
jgi:hypothetical protein